MKLFVGILFLFFSLSVLAVTVETQVSDIDHSTVPGESTLIFLSNGRVAKVNSNQLPLLEELHHARSSGDWLLISLDDDRQITKVAPSSGPVKSSGTSAVKSLENYTPSIIGSLQEATDLFRSSRANHKDSQCFNRAHVWTYDWRVKNKLFTSKIWLFFTRRYIRRFNFEWWFHVSPYFHVQEDGEIRERVADVKYVKGGPIKLKQWTDIFLRNDADCPVVNSYSEWANYPETGWCYLMKSSMYYYRPLDLEVLEKDGLERNVWDPNEVREAYKEAFDIDV